MLLEDIEADGTVRVNIGVIDPRREIDLSWLERVVGWEVDIEEIDSTGKR